MTATLIKGTEIREQILEEIIAEVKQIKEKHGVVPGLVTILVGQSPASISYVTLKIKTPTASDSRKFKMTSRWTSRKRIYWR